MTLPNPSTGDTVQATDISGIKNHLEGASGSTAPYHLRQSTGNFLITLPDAAGATKLRVNNSAGVEVFSVNSDGTITNSGTYAPGAIILPTSASPAPTVDGSIVWDSDDNNIAVGNGSTTQVFYSDDKGPNVASASTITPSNGHFFHVTGTTTITGISAKPAGLEIILYFENALTITHNATSFILREAKSRVVAAGEVARFVSEGSGNWREISTGATYPLITTADAVYNNTTTLTPISPLSYEVVSGAVYRGEFFAVWAAHATSDIKIGFSFPGGTFTYINFINGTWGEGSLATSGSYSGAGAGVGIKRSTWSNFTYECSSSGTFAMQGAQLTSDVNETRIYAGATLQLTRVK